MAERHERALFVGSNSYETREIISWLYWAAQDVFHEVYPTLNLNDQDWGVIVEIAIEKDAACRVLAHHVASRLNAHLIYDDQLDARAVAKELEEGVNGHTL